MDEMLTTEEAAKACGVSPATLGSWRSRKKGPPYHKIGGAVRYDRATLRAWLDGVLVQHESQPVASGGDK